MRLKGNKTVVMKYLMSCICSIFKFEDQTHGGRVCYQANLYITLGLYLDLPRNRAQIFSRRRSANGRFFYVFCGKERERELRAGANYRNGKWQAKDFEKV